MLCKLLYLESLSCVLLQRKKKQALSATSLCAFFSPNRNRRATGRSVCGTGGFIQLVRYFDPMDFRTPGSVDPPPTDEINYKYLAL